MSSLFQTNAFQDLFNEVNDQQLSTSTPVSMHSLIQRNLSTDTIKYLTLSSSQSSASSPGQSTIDSPYTRMSRNLSMLLDEVDKMDGERLMSRLQQAHMLRSFEDMRLEHLRIPDHSEQPQQHRIKGQANRSIWVGNVNVSEEALKKAFESYGPIESVKRVESKSCAFVNFYHLDHAILARKAMNNSRLGGMVIKTGFAKSAPTSPIVDEVTSLSSPPSLRAPQYFIKPSEDAFLESLSPLPKDIVSFAPDHLKQIRIDLERQDGEFVQSTYNEFKDNLLSLSVDTMGNIIVQRLAELGSMDRRMEMVKRLARWLPTLSCHKNGTWVVQKFVALAANPGYAHDPPEAFLAMQQIIANALSPCLVALLRDQYGNYVCQGCLGMGPPHSAFLLDGLIWRCVEIGKSRFGARAMKSILEGQRAEGSALQRHYDDNYKLRIGEAVIDGISELAISPHGALIVISLLEDDGSIFTPSRILSKLLSEHSGKVPTLVLLNRHSLSIIETCLDMQPDCKSIVKKQLEEKVDIQRMLSDQCGSNFLERFLMRVDMDISSIKKRVLQCIGKAPAHSVEHGECLSRIKQFASSL